MGRSGFAHVPNNGAPDQFKTVQRLPTQSSDTPNPFRSGLCTHPQCRLHRSHPPYPCWRLCPFGAERPKMVSGICSSPCTCPCEGPCNRANHSSVSHPMRGECRQCPYRSHGCSWCSAHGMCNSHQQNHSAPVAPTPVVAAAVVEGEPPLPPTPSIPILSPRSRP